MEKITIVDNFEQIRGLLKFDSDDDFYFVELLQRKKDNPDFGSNNRLIKYYYITILKYYQILFNTKSANRELAEVLTKIVNTKKDKIPASSLHTISLLYDLIYLLYRYQTVLKKAEKTTDSKFDSVIKYINSHYSEIVNTALISEKFGYDESYFCRKFKAATGLPVMKYIKVLRLEHAQFLLKNTNENIQAITTACGFNDHCYFTRSFKEYFGFTPSEYRSRCLKSRNSNKS